MNKQNDTSAIPVDLIRVIAIIGVILLHASNDLTSQITSLPILRWWMVDIYQSVGRMGVPLFLMLSGVLLLAPSKKEEEISYFFKKRFIRIGLPFIFWSSIYFFGHFTLKINP
jgi:surface polysaccharide O-acyltransferase-like enzyme